MSPQGDPFAYAARAVTSAVATIHRIAPPRISTRRATRSSKATIRPSVGAGVMSTTGKSTCPIRSWRMLHSSAVSSPLHSKAAAMRLFLLWPWMAGMPEMLEQFPAPIHACRENAQRKPAAHHAADSMHQLHPAPQQHGHAAFHARHARANGRVGRVNGKVRRITARHSSTHEFFPHDHRLHAALMLFCPTTQVRPCYGASISWSGRPCSSNSAYLSWIGRSRACTGPKFSCNR